MAKKCTKKRDARAKLLFCQSQPIACFFAVLVNVTVVVARLSTGLFFMIEMRVSYGVRQDSSKL